MVWSFLGLFDAVDAQLSSDPRYTLDDLSRIFRVKRHDIEKSVREKRGLSFRKYKNRRLLETCVTFLIDNPALSIKDTALTLGFRRRRDFSRFMKNSTGKTPTEIRRVGTVNVDLSAAWSH